MDGEDDDDGGGCTSSTLTDDWSVSLRIGLLIQKDTVYKEKSDHLHIFTEISNGVWVQVSSRMHIVA